MTETQAVIATEIVSKENDAEITTSQDKQKGGYDFNTLIEKYDRETVSKMLKEVIVMIKSEMEAKKSSSTTQLLFPSLKARIPEYLFQLMNEYEQENDCKSKTTSAVAPMDSTPQKECRDMSIYNDLMNEFSQQLKRGSESSPSEKITNRNVHDIATRVKKIVGTSEVHPKLTVSEQSYHSQRLSFSPVSNETIPNASFTLSDDTPSLMLDYQSILHGSGGLVSLKRCIVQKSDSADKPVETIKAQSTEKEESEKTSDTTPAESQGCNNDVEIKSIEESIKKESQPTEDQEVVESILSTDLQKSKSETLQDQETKMIHPATRSQAKRSSQQESESHVLPNHRESSTSKNIQETESQNSHSDDDKMLIRNRSYRSQKSKGDESESHGKSSAKEGQVIENEQPVKAPKKRESDDLSGIGFIDGYEFVTNIINDHVIPYELVEDIQDVKGLRDQIQNATITSWIELAEPLNQLIEALSERIRSIGKYSSYQIEEFDTNLQTIKDYVDNEAAEDDSDNVSEESFSDSENMEIERKDAMEERRADIQLRRSSRKRKGNRRLVDYEENDNVQSGQKKKKL